MDKVKFKCIDLAVDDRKGIVGGSSGAAVIGFSEYQKCHDVWEVYHGKEQHYDEKTLRRFKVGHREEGHIAEDISEEYPDLQLRKTEKAYQRQDLPWMICHPDRLVVGRDRKLAVEIKSDFSRNSRFDDDKTDTDTVPYSYLIQCLFYFWCGVVDLDGEVWLFRKYNGELYRYIIRYSNDPEAYDELFRMIVDEVSKWDDPDYEPPVDKDDFNGRMAQVVLEKGKEKALEDEEQKKLVRRYIELRGQKKAAEEEMESLKVLITDYFTDGSTKLTIDGEKMLTLVKCKGKELFDKGKFALENPELYKKYAYTGDETYQLR